MQERSGENKTKTQRHEESSISAAVFACCVCVGCVGRAGSAVFGIGVLVALIVHVLPEPPASLTFSKQRLFKYTQYGALMPTTLLCLGVRYSSSTLKRTMNSIQYIQLPQLFGRRFQRIVDRKKRIPENWSDVCVFHFDAQTVHRGLGFPHRLTTRSHSCD